MPLKQVTEAEHAERVARALGSLQSAALAYADNQRSAVQSDVARHSFPMRTEELGRAAYAYVRELRRPKKSAVSR